MRYQVSLGGRRYVIDVDGARVTVDGIECRAELLALPGTPLRQLVLDGRSWTLLMESAARGAWKAALQIWNALDSLNEELAGELGAPLRVGMGLNVGVAVVGLIGNAEHRSLQFLHLPR